jgi:ABC-type polar amino acid transport system ATPase subunit
MQYPCLPLFDEKTTALDKTTVAAKRQRMLTLKNNSMPD